MTSKSGGKWSPEAGGYVKNGKVISKTPEYSGGGSTVKASSRSITPAISTSRSSSSSATPSYQQYLGGYFGGSPEAYAAEIKKKEADPNAIWTDKAAADAFKAAYPSLFSGTNMPSITPVAAQAPAAATNPGDYNFNQLQSLFSQQTPYEQLLRDLMSQQPAYTAPSESELLTQAQQYANLQTSPLLSAIQNSISQKNLAQENARRDIEAAYAGVPARAQSLLEEARRSALENAISRGMGRSGVVDWQTAKLSAPIMQSVTESEQKKAAELANIAATIANIQSEGARQMQDIERQRGLLESSKLADLRQQALQNALNQQAATWGQGYQLAALGQNANTAQQNLLMSLLPLYMY